MTTNTKIQPLIEDLGHILPGKFLTSTEFKRWLVEHNLDELWEHCVTSARQNRHIVMFGYDHDAGDARTAFGYLITIIFERQRTALPVFLHDFLSFYAKECSEYVDISNIEKDLLAVGYTKDDVSVLDSIFVPKSIEEKKEEEQTQEQRIRSLEEYYVGIKDETTRASIDAYLKWHSESLLYLSNYYTEANADYAAFKHLDNSGNGHVLRQNYKSIYSVYNLLMKGVTNQLKANSVDKEKKTPLVFISHSHEDEDFVVALVNLMEDMGFTKDTLFCSSVREYGIPLSGDIFETIRGLFLDHDLYVVFVHSPRFYSSAVSLNEMGAAWVLKTGFCSFLTNDMDYGKMKGVVNNAKISIKVDEKEAPALLNDLYRHFSSMFSFHEMNISKWERKRDQFLSVVRSLKYEDVKETVGENNVDTEYKKLLIEKMKIEASDRLKACIRGNIVKGYPNGKRVLKIFNAGASMARNVHVNWLNESCDIISDSDFSSIGELTPQNSRSYTLHLTQNHPETMILRYTWDDDYAEGNQIEESLQL